MIEVRRMTVILSIMQRWHRTPAAVIPWWLSGSEEG